MLFVITTIRPHHFSITGLFLQVVFVYTFRVCLSVQWTVEKTLSGLGCYLGWWVRWVQGCAMCMGILIAYHKKQSLEWNTGQPSVTKQICGVAVWECVKRSFPVVSGAGARNGVLDWGPGHLWERWFAGFWHPMGFSGGINVEKHIQFMREKLTGFCSGNNQ